MSETAIIEEVKVPIGDIELPGEFVFPKDSASFVIFSHGSGSSRLSLRNQFVAEALRDKGISTFLFDLLAREEDDTSTRFNIDLLTDRLVLATEWLMKQAFARDLTIGYFGASTGAASALNATARLGNSIKAVVSRGGRPDLAMSSLSKVQAPTMFIVGSNDHEVLQLNKTAFDKLNAKKELHIVSGASHLFPEPGKLGEVATIASDWFKKHLVH